MFANLKVAILKMPDELRKQLIDVVCKNFDADSAFFTENGRITVVIHTYKIAYEHLFQHKLKPSLFETGQYHEQEFDKLIFIGAVFSADPSACIKVSETVCRPKTN